MPFFCLASAVQPDPLACAASNRAPTLSATCGHTAPSQASERREAAGLDMRRMVATLAGRLSSLGVARNTTAQASAPAAAAARPGEVPAPPAEEPAPGHSAAAVPAVSLLGLAAELTEAAGGSRPTPQVTSFSPACVPFEAFAYVPG